MEFSESEHKIKFRHEKLHKIFYIKLSQFHRQGDFPLQANFRESYVSYNKVYYFDYIIALQ